MIQPARQAAEATQKATYDDVMNAPPHLLTELINGRLHTMPRPSSPHLGASGNLYGVLKHDFGFRHSKPGGWRILNEPELHFGNDVLIPDIASWRLQTMPLYPNVPFFTIAPDWICEVLSDSTQKIDRNEKQEIYAREGIPYLWYVDPIAKTLEVLELCGDRLVPLVVLDGAAEVSQPPFHAVSFPLAWLWESDWDFGDLAGNNGGGGDELS